MCGVCVRMCVCVVCACVRLSRNMAHTSSGSGSGGPAVVSCDQENKLREERMEKDAKLLTIQSHTYSI